MAEDPKPLEGIILNPGDEGALVTIENRNPVEVFTDPGIMEAVLSLIDRQARALHTALYPYFGA